MLQLLLRAHGGPRNERIRRGRRDMFTFILGGAQCGRGACLGKDLSLMLARPPGRLARPARIRNLITAIVIDLGEIRDIHYGNLCILAQSRMQEEEGRRKRRRCRREDADVFRESGGTAE